MNPWLTGFRLFTILAGGMLAGTAAFYFVKWASLVGKGNPYTSGWLFLTAGMFVVGVSTSYFRVDFLLHAEPLSLRDGIGIVPIVLFLLALFSSRRFAIEEAKWKADK